MKGLSSWVIEPVICRFWVHAYTTRVWKVSFMIKSLKLWPVFLEAWNVQHRVAYKDHGSVPFYQMTYSHYLNTIFTQLWLHALIILAVSTDMQSIEGPCWHAPRMSTSKHVGSVAWRTTPFENEAIDRTRDKLVLVKFFWARNQVESQQFK